MAWLLLTETSARIAPLHTQRLCLEDTDYSIVKSNWQARVELNVRGLLHARDCDYDLGYVGSDIFDHETRRTQVDHQQHPVASGSDLSCAVLADRLLCRHLGVC